MGLTFEHLTSAQTIWFTLFDTRSGNLSQNLMIHKKYWGCRFADAGSPFYGFVTIGLAQSRNLVVTAWRR